MGHEGLDPSLEQLIGPYKASKYQAELEARSFMKRGLPVIVVNPSTPVGSQDQKPTPTGKIIAGGERAASPYLFHFEFRMDVESGVHTLICTKQRGGFFKTGERVPWPNLAEIFTSRGIYALLDSVKEPEAPDSEETLGQKAEAFLGLKVSEVSEDELAKLSEECRAAYKSGGLEDFRKDKGVKTRAARLSPAHLAEFKQVIKDLADIGK